MTRRLSGLIAAAVVVASSLLLVLLGGSDAGEQSPVPVPATAESARADVARAGFPGGDRAPALLVLTRDDGAALTPADIAAAQARSEGPPVQVSEDGRAAIAVIPLRADLSGFALGDEITALRTAARDGLPAGLRVQVTGGPAFGADIADSFSGANITLLTVTAAVVAVLLIATYRSPVLWLVPLLVIAFADRVGGVVGSAVAEGLGLSPDGSTTGITSVLVFGAGTNYALLLISRYREELSRTTLTTTRCAPRCGGPDPPSWPATPPWCWRC